MAHKLFWHLPPNDKGRLRSYNNKFPRFGNLDQKLLILTIALPGLELSRDGSTNLSAWLEESRWPPSSFCPSIKRNDCEHRFLLASLQVAWTSRPLTFHQWECNDRVSDSSREPGKLVEGIFPLISILRSREDSMRFASWKSLPEIPVIQSTFFLAT